MIRVLYFASLRERLGQGVETLSDHPADIAGLRAELAARGGVWSEVFATDQRVLAAVNQEMADAGQRLRDGDEVGFFPPVTGG
ncbi:MAG: MoaD/ThiS family protein [Chromatiaceae bacterium]|nr:MoaD/ThiS family protein [Gammaproteobacteria bacterium]MCP5304811.1 MoaD/ThiS family protein [Chromatiaceae bacterium]MCP5314770.1 MoaD/ThiS family protein [Chromatiaceae bacterium]